MRFRWSSPGFDPKELTWPVPPEEKETLALYARAIELQKQAITGERPADESARQKAEEQAVTLALEASRRPLHGILRGPARRAGPERGNPWPIWSSPAGNALQAEGKLDAALDRYVAAECIALHARQCRPWLVVADGLEIRVCEQLTNWACAKRTEAPARAQVAANDGESMAQAAYVLRRRPTRLSPGTSRPGR